MYERLVDIAHGFTADVSLPIATAILSAIVAAAGGVSWAATELWTEDKVRDGIIAHEARLEPRVARIEARAEVVVRRQAEFRRDIDVIVAKLEGADARAERIEQMVDELLRRRFDDGAGK